MENHQSTVGRRHFSQWLLAAPTALAGRAWGQDYPSRPIRIITPYAAGGGSDPYARVTAQWLSTQLGQSVIVDNKPGGNTVIGAQAAATAAPDGYTLFLTTDQTLEINPFLYEKLPYDPLKDFVPVIKVIETGQCLLVPAKLPAKNLREFVALVKSQPGKHSYGSAGGAGSPSHLNMEKFRKELGLDMVHVPYKGSAPALTELAAGRISAVIAGLGGAAGLIKAGTIRPLAVGTLKRGQAFPDIPTFSEALGRPYEYLQNWMGFFVPAGTPKPIISKLAAELQRGLSEPAVANQIISQGYVSSVLTMEDFGRSIAEGQKKWARAIKDSGVKLE